MNIGKKFEQNFKNSMSENIFLLRLKDGTASFSKSTSNVRFQHYNPADFIIHFQGYLFLAELKSYAGKAIPFSCFREKQMIELSKLQHRKTEVAIAIFNFRDTEETFILDYVKLEDFMIQNVSCSYNLNIHLDYIKKPRKSFSVEFCRINGIKIHQVKKKVNYTYDIESALSEFIKNKGVDSNGN